MHWPFHFRSVKFNEDRIFYCYLLWFLCHLFFRCYLPQLCRFRLQWQVVCQVVRSCELLFLVPFSSAGVNTASCFIADVLCAFHQTFCHVCRRKIVSSATLDLLQKVLYHCPTNSSDAVLPQFMSWLLTFINRRPRFLDSLSVSLCLLRR